MKKYDHTFFRIFCSIFTMDFLILLLLFFSKFKNYEIQKIIFLTVIFIVLLSFFIIIIMVILKAKNENLAIKYRYEFMLRKKEMKHEEKIVTINKAASYDEMREHIEKEILDLQNKLSSTPEKWKDSYHLPLAAQSLNNVAGPVQYSTFLNKFGIKETDLKIDNELIFMLTPFSEKANTIFKLCKEISNSCGMKLYRGDEQFSYTDILANIIRYIVKARIIIVNIEGKNPNVFYELGIAHTLGKPTILISSSIDGTPFDIAQHRIILYDNLENLNDLLHKEIMKILVEH